jgi:hypothetical protein
VPSPWGSTLRLFSGAKIQGVTHSFLVATLDIDQVMIRRPEAEVVIHAVSHEARVNEDRVYTRSATSSGTVSALVSSLVRSALGAGHPIVNTLTTDTDLPAGAYPLDGDVWPTIQSMMNEAGGEAVFGADGTLYLRDLPVKGTPVAHLSVGAGGSVVAYDSTKRWAYNSVAVIYDDGASTQVGLWQDTTSTSLTKVSGSYGRHTIIERISVDAGHLPTSTRADSHARAIGRRAAAPYRRVQVETIPQTWLEPGDTIQVTYLGGTTETLLITGHTWPLSQLEVATITTGDDQYTSGV